MSEQHKEDSATLHHEGGVLLLPSEEERAEQARKASEAAEKEAEHDYKREQLKIQKGSNRTQFFLVIFGLVGIVISIAGTAISINQANIASENAEQAKRAADLASDSFEINNGNFERMMARTIDQTHAQIEAANAASRADDIANKTLERAETTYREDERAWVIIDQITPVKTLPAQEQNGIPANFRYAIYMKNAGKSIARDVQIHIKRRFGGEILGSFDIDEFQNGMLKGREGVDYDRAVVGPQSLAPGARPAVPFYFFSAAPLVAHDLYAPSQMVGRIDYIDAFNIPHWTKFCYSPSDDKGTLDPCYTGNSVDTNTEKPDTASTKGYPAH